jgi:hypothetical protein
MSFTRFIKEVVEMYGSEVWLKSIVVEKCKGDCEQCVVCIPNIL